MTLKRLWETDRRPDSEYAELFDDGTGFACTRLLDPRSDADSHADIQVLDQALVWNLGRCLHLLGRHAVENCGAWGDALVDARLTGNDMRLAHSQRVQVGGGAWFPRSEEIERGHVLPEAVSTHTITVEAASTVGPDLARATRLIATDLFHAFGSAEVRQIAADGGLRTRYLGGDGELRAWAQGHGIDVSDETVTGG